MVKIREDFKFKKIKNFFSEDEVKLLTTYIDIKNRISVDNFDEAKDWGQGFYGDPIMESMLLNKKDNLVEFKKRLEKIDLIDDFYVQKLNKDYVLVKIKYLGKISKIINKLKDQKINLKMIAGQWQLTII